MFHVCTIQAQPYNCPFKNSAWMHMAEGLCKPLSRVSSQHEASTMWTKVELRLSEHTPLVTGQLQVLCQSHFSSFQFLKAISMPISQYTVNFLGSDLQNIPCKYTAFPSKKYKGCKQPHSHRPWFSWGTSTTLTSAGKTIQLGRRNPGGSYRASMITF